jgi:dsDNA-binding SOS-regulon protein
MAMSTNEKRKTIISQSPSPWDRILNEFKVKILRSWLKEWMIEMYKHKRETLSLFLSSKCMRKLSLEIWGKNRFWIFFKPDSARSLRCDLPVNMSICPGKQCHRLELDFQIPRLLSGHENAPRERGCASEDQRQIHTWYCHLWPPDQCKSTGQTAW